MAQAQSGSPTHPWIGFAQVSHQERLQPLWVWIVQREPRQGITHPVSVSRLNLRKGFGPLDGGEFLVLHANSSKCSLCGPSYRPLLKRFRDLRSIGYVSSSARVHDCSLDHIPLDHDVNKIVFLTFRTHCISICNQIPKRRPAGVVEIERRVPCYRIANGVIINRSMAVERNIDFSHPDKTASGTADVCVQPVCDHVFTPCVLTLVLRLSIGNPVNSGLWHAQRVRISLAYFS